jgi:hypothetical protein
VVSAALRLKIPLSPDLESISACHSWSNVSLSGRPLYATLLFAKARCASPTHLDHLRNVSQLEGTFVVIQGTFLSFREHSPSFREHSSASVNIRCHSGNIPQLQGTFVVILGTFVIIRGTLLSGGPPAVGHTLLLAKARWPSATHLAEQTPGNIRQLQGTFFIIQETFFIIQGT